MKTKILACATLKNELNALCEKNRLSYETVWIESGMHNHPEKLRERIVQKLLEIRDCDRLLLAFGNCGNALEHLRKGPYELIFPKADDCISMFFGSNAARNAYGREHRAVYMTQGWLDGESNIITEYQQLLERYDKETADSVIDMMYGHYEELALLDTKVTDIRKLWEETAPVEEFAKLKRNVVPASLSYLEQLLTGPWDGEKFRIIPASVSSF